MTYFRPLQNVMTVSIAIQMWKKLCICLTARKWFNYGQNPAIYCCKEEILILYKWKTSLCILCFAIFTWTKRISIYIWCAHQWAPVCSGYKVPREAGWYAEKLYVMLPYQFLMSQYLIVRGFSVSESISFARANTYNKQRIFDFSV